MKYIIIIILIIEKEYLQSGYKLGLWYQIGSNPGFAT